VGDSTLRIPDAASLRRSDRGENQFLCESKQRRAAFCARPGHRRFLFRRILPNRSMPRRFVFANPTRHSSRSCSNSHRSRSLLRLVFIQRGRRSKRSARRPCFHSTAGGDRSRSTNRRRHDHWAQGATSGHETVIGSACHIYPHVTIRERSRIGSRVIITAARQSVPMVSVSK